MPKLIMLAGPSGSGKSTYAERLREEMTEKPNYDLTVVVSSDAIRGELYGDESDQTDHQRVFDVAHAEIKTHLGQGTNVIFDATNLIARFRTVPLDIAFAAGAPRELHYMTTPIGTCLMRNAGRERKVPNDVIGRQVQQRRYDLNQALGSFFDEGFRAIKLID